jgi:pSer/pThr/pTyr-binding forkhead associated (FHA) protein
MTRLESDEEIRQALDARRARLAGKRPPAKGQPGKEPVAVAELAEPDTQPERPQDRPPMALLCVLDDGKLDGEWIRLRGDRYLIGRTEGDVRIPHDAMMSGRHAEISRQRGPGGFRWLLTDLQSTNGTFVRVGSTILRHHNELRIGGNHYRFEAPASSAAAADEAGPAAQDQATRSYQGPSVRSLVPSLVELVGGSTGQRFALTLPEYWIGRDPKACPIARPDDLLLNPRHARLFRDAKAQWHIENNRSVNGLWLRIDQIPLDTACQFRLGEQRFLLRVL